MSNELSGVTVAVLTANSGVEQVELIRPWQAVLEAGGQPVLLAPQVGQVQAFNSDVEKADTFRAQVAAHEASAGDYGALVIPGGTTNADTLRTIPAAVDFVKSFVRAAKPIPSICHGPWLLAEADVLRGKTMTSFPSLQTDLRNAGATWVDQEVFVCPTEGWTLVTSRKPDDLDAFTTALVEQFSAAPK